mmetsp:Transcript_26836/g.75885  ORF Transcript_26836/g.75885 Transcript_26836/m.75885 type:complete len:362 (+) Transcript_26836:1081-2166(+)
MLGGVGVLAPLLVVLGDCHVLLPCALPGEAVLVDDHLVVALRQAECLLVVLRDQQELHGAGGVALLAAVLGDKRGARRELRLPHQLEGPVGLVQVLQAQADHAVHVVGALVGHQGLGVGSTALLGLRVQPVQLWRVDLAHQRRGSLEVQILNVQLRRLVVGAGLLVQLRRLHVLPHLCEDLRAVLADRRVFELDGGAHPAAQVAETDGRACDASLALGVVTGLLRLAAAHRLVVVGLGLLVLAPPLELQGALEVDLREPLRGERLREADRLVPLEEVAVDVQGRLGAAAREEVLPRLVEVAEYAGDVAAKQQLVLDGLQAVEVEDHARGEGLPVRLLRPADIEALEAPATHGYPELLLPQR